MRASVSTWRNSLPVQAYGSSCVHATGNADCLPFGELAADGLDVALLTLDVTDDQTIARLL
jgi:hypothetical protein